MILVPQAHVNCGHTNPDRSESNAGYCNGASRAVGISARRSLFAGRIVKFQGASLYRHYLPLVRAALGRDEARRARDEGQSMSLDAALIYASEGLESS